MDQQLHAWFRYTVIFGIYLKRNPTNKVHNGTGTGDFQVLRPGPTRRAWLRRQRGLNVHRLQRYYMHLILIWIIVVYLNGVLWRRRIESSILTWFVGTILFTSQALANFLIIIETLWQQQAHEAFLAQLQNIEISLKLRLQLDIEKDRFAANLRLYLCFICGISLLGLKLFLLSTIWLRYISYFWYGLWFVFTMRLRIIQLLIYLRVLHYYMHCLTESLKQIVAYHMVPQWQTLDINYTQLKSHMSHLLAIKDIYALIYEAFELFNKFSGWSILMITTCYMLDISCNVYWSLLSLNGFAARQYYYIASLFWLLPVVTTIWHICRLSDECSEVDRCIAHLLSKIIIPSTSQELATYRLALHQFSMQVQLKHIAVTAKQFFNLNMRLLMLIFTSIAAYLVIIIQFLTS